MIFTNYTELLQQQSVFRAHEYHRPGFPVEVRVPEREAYTVGNPASPLVRLLATKLLTALHDGSNTFATARAALDRVLADPDANVGTWGAAVSVARTMCDLPRVARHT